MVKFERFKVGVLTCKLRKHYQRAQFFNPRPQAFGVNGSSHPNKETLQGRKIALEWHYNFLSLDFFLWDCGFVWSVSEESEQVLLRWEHAWTTWRSDLTGLVLSFSFFRRTLLGAWPVHEKLPSDSVSGSKFLRPSSQLLQCSRSFQRIFPSRFSSDTILSNIKGNDLLFIRHLKYLKNYQSQKKIFKNFAHNFIRNFADVFFCAVARLTNKYKKRIDLLVTDSKTKTINESVTFKVTHFVFSKIAIID